MWRSSVAAKTIHYFPVVCVTGCRLCPATVWKHRAHSHIGDTCTSSRSRFDLILVVFTRIDDVHNTQPTHFSNCRRSWQSRVSIRVHIRWGGDACGGLQRADSARRVKELGRAKSSVVLVKKKVRNSYALLWAHTVKPEGATLWLYVAPQESHRTTSIASTNTQHTHRTRAKRIHAR